VSSALAREAQRQQLLLRALWHDDVDPPLPGWLRDGRIAQGIAAYRSNASAIAERALQVAYPTVAALVGEAAFAALSRDLWQLHPPACGDLGEWGAALPELIAGNPALAIEAYLPDSARLDWQVHRASRAADDHPTQRCLDALGTEDPERLQFTLRSGCALLSSAWPVAGLWSAHQRDAREDRFSDVRALFAAGVGEHAFVHRDGLAVRVVTFEPAAAAFTTAVLAGRTLAAALDSAGDAFDFPAWLVQALQGRWLLGVHPPAQLQSTEAT
jgi:hypothetical protein